MPGHIHLDPSRNRKNYVRFVNADHPHLVLVSPRTHIDLHRRVV